MWSLHNIIHTAHGDSQAFLHAGILKIWDQAPLSHRNSKNTAQRLQTQRQQISIVYMDPFCTEISDLIKM